MSETPTEQDAASAATINEEVLTDAQEYAAHEEEVIDGSYVTTEGRVFTVTGEDWETIIPPAEGEQERLIVNMGPQHPSTHGVGRFVLDLDGETVTECRAAIGYLHTGIEKNLEFRSWTQGTTFVTRMDYLSPNSG